MKFESLYEEAGWKVDYDRPGYNESYLAFWTFKIKKIKEFIGSAVPAF